MGAAWDAIVVGGGLAGLAATTALAESGARVLLLEWRPYLGGRAYSYCHPALNEVLDSQHVVLGCCTNVVDMMARAGAAETIRWYDELTFVEPGGRRSVLRPGLLPAPLHQTQSFLRAPMLGMRDKLAIARGLLPFLRGYPESDDRSVVAWLRSTGQTERAIRHFWEPILVGALNDSFERCSLKYAGKVFHESFLRSAEGGRLGIPGKPLSEFFAPVLEAAQARGAEVRFQQKVTALRREGDGRWCVVLGSGATMEARNVILAVAPEQARSMCGELAEEQGLRAAVEGIVRAPITTVHLWYDRPVTELDHAVLLDARIQWMFQKSRIRGVQPGGESYLELTISASAPELTMDRESVLRSALEELPQFLPEVGSAKLVRSAVLKEARATFSVVPKFDASRPAQRTGVPGVFLAGDWTATEWPSTMEGAVRSGRLAAGEMVGARSRFLAAELPATGLMRMLAR